MSKKCLCGFGVKGRVAHGNNQLPSYLLVEVSARLQLPEKKASKAATCSQVDRRLLAGIRGCVNGGPGLQQMLQTIHLREKNSSSTPSRFCPGSCLKPPRPPPLASHPCALPDTDVHPKASPVPVRPSGLLSRVFKNRDHLTLLSAPWHPKGENGGRSSNAG